MAKAAIACYIAPTTSPPDAWWKAGTLCSSRPRRTFYRRIVLLATTTLSSIILRVTYVTTLSTSSTTFRPRLLEPGPTTTGMIKLFGDRREMKDRVNDLYGTSSGGVSIGASRGWGVVGTSPPPTAPPPPAGSPRVSTRADPQGSEGVVPGAGAGSGQSRKLKHLETLAHFYAKAVFAGYCSRGENF